MVRPHCRIDSCTRTEAAPPAARGLSFAEGAAAYERIRGALDALTAEEVGIIRANVTVAVSVVFGALPNVEARLERLRRATPELDFDELERLRDYTLALYYLHLMTTPAGAATADLPELLAEAAPLRAKMLSIAESLVLFDYFPAERVAAIRSGSGHLDTAEDLGTLVRLFREAGPELTAKTPVTEAMLERAGELCFQIVAALGRRRVGTDGAGTPSRFEDDKARAFRLVVRTYNEARRGLTFLRWNDGDADALAPSIFAARRRKRGAPAGEAPANEAPANEAPANEVPAASAAPASDAAPANAALANHATPAGEAPANDATRAGAARTNGATPAGAARANGATPADVARANDATPAGEAPANDATPTGADATGTQ